MGRGLFLGGQLCPPSQGGMALANPNFVGSNQIRRGNTYGEGEFLGGQPRHCICTNASHGLSLVFFTLSLKCLSLCNIHFQVQQKG